MSDSSLTKKEVCVWGGVTLTHTKIKVKKKSSYRVEDIYNTYNKGLVSRIFYFKNTNKSKRNG